MSGETKGPIPRDLLHEYGRDPLVIEQQEQLERRDPGQRQEVPEDRGCGSAPWLVIVRSEIEGGRGPSCIVVATYAALRTWLLREGVTIVSLEAAAAVPVLMEAVRLFAEPFLNLDTMPCHRTGTDPKLCLRCRRVVIAREALARAGGRT